MLNKKPTNLVWLKDNKPINIDGGRVQPMDSETENEYKLLVKQANVEDSGLYTAMVINGTGKASCSAQLIVHER